MINGVTCSLDCKKNDILFGMESEYHGVLSKFPKIFHISSGANQSLTPLKLAKYIFTNHTELFIRTAMSSSHVKAYKNIQRDELITSSLYSVHALALMFLGLNKAKEMIENLEILSYANLSICFPSGNEWSYKVQNLLNGSSISQINKDPLFKKLNKEQEDTASFELIQPNIQRFFRYLQPFIDQSMLEKSEKESIEKFEECLSKIDYNFNKEVIQSLKIEIDKNALKVNHDTSFLYCVAGVLVNSCREIFAIEQRFPLSIF